MASTPFQFPRVNKAFVKGLFWLAVFLFLASIFSSFRVIYDNFLKKPEVRQETVVVGSQVVEDKLASWSQRAIVVHNRGNADARNVYIQFTVPNGKITRVEPYSEEPFNELQTSVSESRAYTLTRLASGAKILFLTWFVSVSPTIDAGSNQVFMTKAPLPIVSTTFDGGTAEAGERLTALEEMQHLGKLLFDGLQSIWLRLEQKLNLSNAGEYIVGTMLPQLGIRYTVTPASANQDMLGALVAIGMLAGFAWLLLNRVWAGLITATFSGLFLWLYLDLKVDVFWLVVPLMLGIAALFTSKSVKERVLLCALLFISIAWLLQSTSVADWSCAANEVSTFALTAIFLCSQADLDGGLVMGLSVLAAYLLVVDL